FFSSSKSLLNVQLARAAIIVEPISCVGILLCLDDHGPWSDGVHCSRIDIDKVASVKIDPVQEFFSARFLDRPFELFASGAGRESQSDLRAGIGFQDVPAFGFSACLPDLFGAL